MPVQTEEDRMIGDSADALFADLGGLGRLRHARTDAQAQLVADGWGGLLLTEAQGGLGFGLRGAAVALQAAGRNLAPEPLAGLAVAAWLLAGTGAQAWDPGPAILPAFAAQAAKGWTSGAIPGLARADALLVFCGDQLRMVTPGTDGASAASFDTLDTGSSGRIGFPALGGRVLAEGATVTGPEGLAARAQDLLRVLGAAELTGLAAEALRITCDYVGTRRQFGVTLSSHQVIQHRLANVQVAVTAAEALVHESVRGFAANADRRQLGTRTAWNRASWAATLATREAIQFHGAIGFTEECDIGLFLRRATTIIAGVNAMLPEEAWFDND